MSAQTPVPGLLRGFFEDYLAAQRDVSQNTIYAYRDACKLFLRFAARHRGRQVIRLQLADLGADTVLAFLTYLESDRHNSAATRNCRLAAIHRFFAYVAGQDPRHAELCRRVLDIPLKKTTSNSMTHLNQDQVKALLAAPPARHRLGLRDRALLTLLCNTCARATEIVQLNIDGLRLETPAQVRILGKGRKERSARCGRSPQTRSVPTSINGQTAPSQTRRCSSTPTASASPASAPGRSSNATERWRPPPWRRSPPSPSARTLSATRPPCTYSSPEPSST